MGSLYISIRLVWEPKLDRAYCCDLASKTWFSVYISKLWIWNDNQHIDCWLCCLIIGWLIRIWTFSQIVPKSELYWKFVTFACIYMYLHWTSHSKRLEQKNKIVCPTNRYMFTIIYCFVWVMMILWAYWLAAWLFLFLFEIWRTGEAIWNSPMLPVQGRLWRNFPKI